MTEQNYTQEWEMTYFVVFGRGDASDDMEFDVPCTEEEYAILTKISDGDEAYEDYTDYEDVDELKDFISRAEEIAYDIAMDDLAAYDEEWDTDEADSLESGGYRVSVRTTIW